MKFFKATAVFNLISNAYTDFFISKMKLRNETLSLNQNNTVNTIIFFPNPASSSLQLNTPNQLENGNLKIISITGQSVLAKQNLSGTDFNFNVSNLLQGIYIVQLTNDNEIFNSKFIKQ